MHSLLNGLNNELMNVTTSSETHFLLGGMDIHINVCRVKVQMKKTCRVAAFHEKST